MLVRNLIIVINPKQLDYKDFEEIGRIINARNSEIRITLLSFDDDIANFPTIDWRLPTLTVSLADIRNNPPLRGHVFFNRQIDKIEQIDIMIRSGIKVPRTDLYNRTNIYSSNVWGDFVIVKSRNLEGSSVGKTAFVTPTRFLDNPEEFDDPVKSILMSGQAMIQEFIPTGPHPTEHRASTFLGRVLYLMRGHSMMTLPKLDPSSKQTYLFDSKFKNPEQGIPRSRSLINDPEILAFAQKIAKAFPGIPLLGVDILKNEDTGMLYALEVNAGGNTWHFSAPSTADGRLQLSREDRIKQFGAWDIAASVLIEKTLYYAK